VLYAVPKDAVESHVPKDHSRYRLYRYLYRYYAGREYGDKFRFKNIWSRGDYMENHMFYWTLGQNPSSHGIVQIVPV
jgi:hypothetical protein